MFPAEADGVRCLGDPETRPVHNLSPLAPDMARPNKPFQLRASPAVMVAVEKLAAVELRSVSAEVEILLREALRRRGVSALEDPPSTDDA